jgi:hypothetical protein
MPFFFVAFAGLTVLASDVSSYIVVGSWLVITVLLGLWVAVSEYFRRRKLRIVLSRTRDSGQVREVRIVASDVVEFEEEEDEGACYAFQVAEDKILFVQGQEFYASPRFPNSDFALVNVLDPSGHSVDFFIRKDGVKLMPIRTVRADVKRQLCLPAHLQIVPGKLAQLEQLLAA